MSLICITEDVQKRIKDQQYSNADYPQKIKLISLL